MYDAGLVGDQRILKDNRMAQRRNDDPWGIPPSPPPQPPPQPNPIPSPRPPLSACPPFPAVVTATMNAMQGFVLVREATPREGRRVNTDRAANFEALLVQRVGEQQAPACSHCRSGYGPWTLCVTSNGLLSGSCANCHYNSEGSRCSFRMLIPTYLI